jgi:hypothetical protein
MRRAHQHREYKQEEDQDAYGYEDQAEIEPARECVD